MKSIPLSAGAEAAAGYGIDPPIMSPNKSLD